MADKMKSFISKQLDLYNISSQASRVSLLPYGDRSYILLSLPDGVSSVAVKAALSNLKLLGGTRRLDSALRRLREQVFSPTAGVRSGAGKLAVVLIAGANDPVGKAELGREGAALSNLDVKLTVIGIGPDVKNDELPAISRDPDQILKIGSVDDLNQATPLISENAGLASGNCC